VTVDEIATYYREMGERTRIVSGRGRLEYLRTWDILTHTLPPSPASILDVGGATGVYAKPLAAAGYQVHLVDLIPEHVADAAAIDGLTASVGDARSLVFATASSTPRCFSGRSITCRTGPIGCGPGPRRAG
jgi:SAM-dependent methyltransferase